MPHELHRKCGRQASRLGDGQCHREQTARFDSPLGGSFRVRVKRWGKSPPRQRRRWRHEKPLPVQGKIGGWTARPIATGMPHPPALRASEATEGRSAARRALREMTAKSRASGWNIIRLTGPKTSLFRLGLAPVGARWRALARHVPASGLPTQKIAGSGAPQSRSYPGLLTSPAR